MLDYAATRQEQDDRITWRKADAQALPFEDAAFDLVCCQFGAMFFPDRPSAYREARRVLKPGGCFLFSAWDRIEENVFADDVTNALAEFFPNDPPRFLARTPHGYHDTALIRSDLEKAAFRTSRSKPGRSRAARPRPVYPRSPIARARRCATRSRPAAPTNSRPPPNTPHPPSRAGTATARSPPKSRRMSFWRVHDPGSALRDWSGRRLVHRVEPPCRPAGRFWPPVACRTAGIGVGCPPEIGY